MTTLVALFMSLMDLVKAELEQVKVTVRHVVTGIVLLLVAGVFLLVSLGWFLAAVYLALEDDLTPEWASVVTGGITLILTALLMLGGRKFLK